MVVRPPGRDHAKDVRLSVRVHDDQQVPDVAEAECHESMFRVGVGIFPGQCVVIIEHGDRLGEADSMFSKICPRFRPVPLEPHVPSASVDTSKPAIRGRGKTGHSGGRSSEGVVARLPGKEQGAFSGGTWVAPTAEIVAL